MVSVLVAVMALTACSKESIRGGGRTLTETRRVAAFSEVKVEGSASVNIVQGTEQKVGVTGYENLLPVYETNVQNGTLVLRFQSDYYKVRNSNIRVEITVPALSKVAVNGSGEYKIKNFTGSNLAGEINGSGEIYLENCVYNKAILQVNGSGYVNAAQLQAKECDIEVNGSGKVDITCSQNLTATILGSGKIKYWGSPSVTVNVSGSGSVTKQ
ncbi:MAG: hypothetical protein JWQ40_716 [Segetibacter sp.]|nr:hypothetical protein [Segetibacter sp.]